MVDPNKRNLHYFESDSMAGLFDSLQSWQVENEKRFLSIGIENDHGRFCCIALTNPSEVIIVDGYFSGGVNVSGHALTVRQG